MIPRPPKLLDILTDGGIEALHKLTGLPFYEHFPVFVSDFTQQAGTSNEF